MFLFRGSWAPKNSRGPWHIRGRYQTAPDGLEYFTGWVILMNVHFYG
jgi:hypothetical protein